MAGSCMVKAWLDELLWFFFLSPANQIDLLFRLSAVITETLRLNHQQL